MFDKKEELPKKNNNFLVVAAVTIGVLLLVVFVVRPGVVGYGVYQQIEDSNVSPKEYAQNIQQLSRDLEIAKANLSSYSAFTGAIVAQVGEMSDGLVECKEEVERSKAAVEEAQKQVSAKETELASLNSKMDQQITDQVAQKTAALEEDKNVCQNSLSEKELELGDAQEKYELLARNAARNICCKAKVDNPQINFYDIANDKIVCLEEGSNTLNC
ncbi:MAG: hypothetical protein AABW53_00815 [Nanoarchaeota archaeon]|mgnify:CR=1 FL=1